MPAGDRTVLLIKYMENISDKIRKRFRYIFLATIIWGVLILPLINKLILGDDFPLSHVIVFSTLISFLATVAPMYWEFPNPPEGKEYFILLYPVFTIPLIIIGIKIKEHAYPVASGSCPGCQS